MSIFFRYTPIFLLLISGVGCSSLKLVQPTASVTGMTVQGVTGDGFTMDFGVDVKNPNTVALPLTATDYQLGVGGVHLLDGKAKPDGSLPAKGSRAVTLPVAVTFENLLAAEKAIQSGGGKIPYDLSGGLSFDTGTPLIGKLRVPISYSGELALNEILKDPKALLGSDAAKKLAGMLLAHLFGK